METGNNNNAAVPQGSVVEIRITPEQYQAMSPEDKAKIDPNVRATIEAGLAASQGGAVPPLPNVVGAPAAAPAGISATPINSGDKSTPVDPAKLEAERLAAERKAFEDLPRAERMKLRREAQEAHARRWFNVVEVDFRSSNDLSAMLAGAIITAVVIGVGYLIIRMIKSE
jgi:hypothetical protein